MGAEATARGFGRLIVVSNRVAPITEGEPTAGGLAAGVLDALRRTGGLWFGWNGETADAGEPTERRVGEITLRTIPLPKRDVDEYYNGFCNGTLWPVLHYRPILATYEDREFDGYLRVNRTFARALASMVTPDDLIWCHDYHLFGLAEALRAEGVRNRVGLFIHTPFPTPQVLMCVPPHADLIRALCAYDLVGFQTETDRQAFIDYLQRHASFEPVRTGVYPIGVDIDSIRAEATAVSEQVYSQRVRGTIGAGSLLISVDRLDYSKGLRHRFRSIGRFFDDLPHWRGRATFLQIAPTTRGDVQSYQALKAELESEAGRINGRHADLDWTPLRVVNRGFARSALMPLYAGAQVGVVTPLRDGMNLVAKEYVAAQDPDNPGALVLSRFAGAAAELDSAVVVNPFDVGGMAIAFGQALAMPREERRDRHADMIAALRRNSLDRWRDRFVSDLVSSTS